MAHRIKDGFAPETREPDEVIVVPGYATVRIFRPQIDEAERTRREREYMRVAMDIYRRRVLEGAADVTR